MARSLRFWAGLGLALAAAALTAAMGDPPRQRPADPELESMARIMPGAAQRHPARADRP